MTYRRSFVLLIVLVLYATKTYGGSLSGECGIDQVGTSVQYSGHVHYDFADSDPEVVIVNVDAYVTGQDYWGDNVDGEFVKHNWPDFWNSTTDYDVSGGFQAASNGGCDTGYIYAETGYSNSVQNTGGTICFPRLCELHDWVDTNGSTTPGGLTGTYDCYDFINECAYPSWGYDFAGWSGAVNSSDACVTFGMNGSDQEITAHFTPTPCGPYDPSCPSDCDPDYDENCTCDPITGICNLDDPLVFNLGNGEWNLSGADLPVSFDIHAVGRKEKLGWTAPASQLAFLALDRDGTGAIESGRELFGNVTLLPNGRRAHDGFEALAQYDVNGDGVIDAKDPVWKSLLLWVDTNHDGISQADELTPIARSSITAIELSRVRTGRRDKSGNYFRYQGHVHIGNRVETFYDILLVPIR